MTASDERRLDSVSLLSKKEINQLVVDWNNTRTEYPRESAVHRLIAEQAITSGDAVAAVCHDEQITYAELDRRASTLARRLAARGVGPEVSVGICIEPSIDLIAGLLAVLKAGGAYVALDPEHPRQRLEYILEDARAGIVLAQKKFDDLLPHNRATVLLESGLYQEEDSESSGPVKSSVSANAVYIVYTSGSTGNPKGIVVSHRALVNECIAFGEHQKLGPGERLFKFAPIGFDVAAEAIFAPLMCGATVVLKTKKAGLGLEELLDYCDSRGVTVMNLPAGYWREWTNQIETGGAKSLSSLRLVIAGNERALPVLNHVEWKNAYGRSEATITTTIYSLPHDWSSDEAGPLPIGRPISNATVYVLDRGDEPVPIGVAGELYIGGDGLARGYLNRPDLTAERFVPCRFGDQPGSRLYRTGDLACYLPDGNIEFIDDRFTIEGASPSKPDGAQTEVESVYTPPRTPLEEVLTGLWAQVLGIERVGINDDFFDLGGHSLLAMQMVARLCDTLQVTLSLRKAFENPTVARLAAAILEDPNGRARVEKTAKIVLKLAKLSEAEAGALLEKKTSTRERRAER
jgi:amino acid adenylation domain-containing protein